MEQVLPERLDLGNVYQLNPYDKIIDIYFTLKDCQYSLRVEDFGDGYETIDVIHRTNRQCSFCGSEWEQFPCYSFEQKRLNELFQQLIEKPNLRLEWIYLPKKEGVKKDD